VVSPLDSLFLPKLPAGQADRGLPWQRWGEGGGAAFNRQTLKSRDHVVLADNLDLLAAMDGGCVDLVYIDPPFGTGKYRVSNGEEGFDDLLDDPGEFVEWLAPCLRQLWRALSEKGSIVIHLDPRTIHHVRLWCDVEFGKEHWENEIIWHYTGGGRSKARFSRKHDVILWYSKSVERAFNLDAVREPYKPTSGYAKGGIVSKAGKKYMPHPEGTPVDDVWDIPIVNPMASERTSYPTQKPVKLLERVVLGLSSPGDVVCDVFSGSGTTAVACREHGRSFICCDSNPDAIGVTMDRLGQVDPEGRSPAVISTGFYRLRVASVETATAAAGRFGREALRVEDCEKNEIVYPSWRRWDKIPEPLEKTDMLLRYQG
jgi:DNA modification methylase